MAAEVYEEDDERGKAKRTKGLFRRGLAKTKEKEKEKDSKAKKKEDSKAEKREKEKHFKTERKEREAKVEKKEKDKESKAERKEKEKSRKKSAQSVEQPEEGSTRQDKGKSKGVFGVPLAVAVENSKLYDGVELPAVVRDCITYVESNALTVQGIYRISAVKSQVSFLRQQYDKKQPVNLEEYDPHAVAALLKQFLREIPEPVLTTALMPKFEEASTITDEKARIEAFQKLLNELPECNRTLLTWVFVHMSHVIEKEPENKMSLQNVAIVLSPTMHINHRVLSILFKYRKIFFKDVTLKKATKPLRWQSSRTSLELPSDTAVSLEEELSRQEAILAKLHEDMNRGIGDKETEEKLWEVQRIVTTLKRKIRQSKKQQAAKATTEKIPEMEEKDKEKEKEKTKEKEKEKTKEKEKEKEKEKDLEKDESKGKDAEPSKEETVSEKTEEVKVEEEDKKENEEVQVVESESDDDSLDCLLATESLYLTEEQELIVLKNELMKRIENERNEVDRLKAEISTIQDERRQSPSNSEDVASQSDESSDSESENDEQLQNILDDLLKQNEELEAKNDELSIAIHEERLHCIRLKSQVQLAQSSQLDVKVEETTPQYGTPHPETAETTV
ncbi:ralA-binding protein 1-like isoform X2 [Ptychodera flava]